MRADEFDRCDAVELAGLVRRGEVTALEVADAAIAAIEARNPLVHAVVHTQFERARREAAAIGPGDARPLAGVPFLLKDHSLMDVGEPYADGLAAAYTLGWRADEHNPDVTSLRDAGVVVLGRTNTAQLALIGTTEPIVPGPTRNPHDRSRSPGGSSGGAGAAVAAAMVPAAHANDIAGSIRIPAAHCGVLGLKPSSARTATKHGEAFGFSCEGVVSRTVRDTAAFLAVLAGEPGLADLPSDPSAALRVGVCVDAFNGATVAPEAAAAATACAQRLRELGHHVDAARPTALFDEQLFPDIAPVLAVVGARELDAWSARLAPVLGRPLGEADVEPATWRTVQQGRAVDAAALRDHLERLAGHRRRILAWWDTYDVLVTPTTAALPLPLGEYARDHTSGRGSAFTRPFNITGQPAMSVPLAHSTGGLPIGVQLVAAPGSDALLLALAAALLPDGVAPAAIGTLGA